MAAGWLDLDANQGSTETWALTMSNKSTGQAVNVTSFTFSGKIRKSATDLKVLGEFTFSITSGVNGQFTVTLPQAVSATLPVLPCNKAQKTPTEFCYDIEYDNAGVTKCFMQGVLRVWPRGSA